MTTLTELYEMLETHDWTYNYSDDNRAYNKGMKEADDIKYARQEQFVNQLLSQYQIINVKITNLQLISKENKAKAQVELTDLVDINNKKITPGGWSKFDTEIIID